MDTEFNIFKNLQLDEKHHSNILKRLLSPNGSHHKDGKFLQLFLISIGLKEIELEILNNAEVTTEKKAGKKGRVDLYVEIPKIDKKSKVKNFEEPILKIVIENKITRAENQPYQLYRYWKNRIFEKEHLDKDFIELKEMDHDSKIKYYEKIYKYSDIKEKNILGFLTYDGSPKPNELTKIKPSNDTYDKLDHLPPVLPISILELNYQDHIIPWLNDCLVEIKNEKDGILYMFIQQYKDYLWNHFKHHR